MHARPFRDVIAALLRDRGYSHDDVADPEDMYWICPGGGPIRPIMSCVAFEVGKGDGTPVAGWNTYPVSVAVPVKDYDPTATCPCRVENGGSGVCGCVMGAPKVTC